MNKKATSENINNITYEAAMERLSEIVRLLDGGKLSLDESVKLFEEGAALAKFCDKCLKDAEMKIVRLQDMPESGEE
ncbi:MAG: exodeoxyribonuclease VII small subunit [Oscillospiraceae bacterium]|nr:exodeoxyribonuclease VII small subunit [Oscillospiraceae bacterium]